MKNKELEIGTIVRVRNQKHPLVITKIKKGNYTLEHANPTSSEKSRYTTYCQLKHIICL